MPAKPCRRWKTLRQRSKALKHLDARSGLADAQPAARIGGAVPGPVVRVMYAQHTVLPQVHDAHDTGVGDPDGGRGACQGLMLACGSLYPCHEIVQGFPMATSVPAAEIRHPVLPFAGGQGAPGAAFPAAEMHLAQARIDAGQGGDAGLFGLLLQCQCQLPATACRRGDDLQGLRQLWQCRQKGLCAVLRCGGIGGYIQLAVADAGIDQRRGVAQQPPGLGREAWRHACAMAYSVAVRLAA